MNGCLKNGMCYRQKYNQCSSCCRSCSEDNTRMYKVFNDSVHGHIALHPLCVSIIDTPQFQRLRNIKQLSVANHVYPGACNSRFEHSLGVCYLAGQMVEALRQNEKFWDRDEPIEITDKEKLMVEIAGLCHDLGHGPFSHTWEKVVSTWDTEWHHEDTSGKMLKYLIQENELERKFEDAQINLSCDIGIIIDFIQGKPRDGHEWYHKKFLYEIVSNSFNGVDVDKWDYFLRDALHLNLNITFDYKRLLNSCTIVEDKNSKNHIGYRDNTALDLYEMYNCRAALHHKAYQHRVVKNIELMLVDAFKEAGEDYVVHGSNGREEKLKNAHKFEEVFSHLTDHIHYNIQFSYEDKLKKSRTILTNIARRKLYTFLGRRRLELKGDSRFKVKEILKEAKKELLEAFPTSTCGQPGIAEVYIDVGKQLDPISKVCFYQKAKNSAVPLYMEWEQVKKNLSPFPFELSEKRFAELLVFCKSIEIDEDHKQIHDRITATLHLE